MGVIPELKLLLGPDFKVEPLANLGPVERESRFRDAFGRLLAIFGRRGVVIFLDDLQWCSSAEFMLISNIAEEANRRVREWEYGEEFRAGDNAQGNGMRQSTGPLDRGSNSNSVPLCSP
jgi:hypothetical protein